MPDEGIGTPTPPEGFTDWATVRPPRSPDNPPIGGWTRVQPCALLYGIFLIVVSRNKTQDGADSGSSRWDFLTNHAHVLVCVAQDPGIRLRDIGDRVGITERATHRIVSELVHEGYVVRKRDGRRNSYTINTKLPLRHPLVENRQVGELLGVLTEG